MEIWTQEEEARRLHARFDLLKEKQGISQAKFARLHGLPGGASLLSQHIKARRPISQEAAVIYARAFNVPLQEISPRIAADVAKINVTPLPNDQEQKSNVEQAPELRDTRRIPVVGEVQGGVDGYLEELQYPVGHGEGYVESQSTDANAYALRVRGDSMHPRYRAGEFIVVEPSIEAQPGDDVVVALKDGRKLLKELNWIRDGEVQLLSVNNHFAPQTLPLSSVLSIQLAAHRVRRNAFHKG